MDTTTQTPPVASSDLLDIVFPFVTVKSKQRWELSFDADSEYPFSLWKGWPDDEDTDKIAVAKTVEAACELVRDDYCNDPELLKADVEDSTWAQMLGWLESWEAQMSNSDYPHSKGE